MRLLNIDAFNVLLSLLLLLLLITGYAFLAISLRDHIKYFGTHILILVTGPPRWQC